jgi:hypothetical protein
MFTRQPVVFGVLVAAQDSAFEAAVHPVTNVVE